MTFYINTDKPDSSEKIARLLEGCIKTNEKSWSEIVFLCIGSDRVTGDCLGPYIGYRLSQYHIPGVFIYGTLQNPVHAVNLSSILSRINHLHPQALIIAIDSSLGEKKHLGYVTIGNGSLYPGAAVQKDLPPVGDIFITGVVNISGILEYLTLQTTRLATVISLADIITQGILCSQPCQKAANIIMSSTGDTLF